MCARMDAIEHLLAVLWNGNGETGDLGHLMDEPPTPRSANSVECTSTMLKRRVGEWNTDVGQVARKLRLEAMRMKQGGTDGATEGTAVTTGKEQP